MALALKSLADKELGVALLTSSDMLTLRTIHLTQTKKTKQNITVCLFQ